MPLKYRNDLKQKYLKSILDYNSKTGVFVWRNRMDWPKHINTRYAGKVAGHTDKKGRLEIHIDRGLYLGHRLAWLYMTGKWPKEEIDHIDLNMSNNKWKNLREATHGQNRHNITPYANNRSGFKGVSFSQKAGKWVAYVNVNKKRYFLGYFTSAKEAYLLREKKSKELHGKFWR